MNPKIFCIGVANIDVVAPVDTGFLLRNRVDKNTSTLMRSADIMDILKELKDPMVIPGGCAANTACGIATEGIDTTFIGMVHDDDYGRLFQKGFEKYGVHYTPVIHPEKHTAVCLTLVTPDKDRSFVFSPDAASWFLAESHLPERDQSAPLIVYTEANLFRMTAGTTKTSMLHAVLEKYRAPDSKIILNLIDTEITIHHRQAIHNLIRDRQIDIIISNQDELMALFSTVNEEDAAAAAASTGQTFITTLGRDGAYIINDGGILHVKSSPIPLEDIVDMVGAGDQFAAGLISALAKGKTLEHACLDGGIRAANILSVAGARPKAA